MHYYLFIYKTFVKFSLCTVILFKSKFHFKFCLCTDKLSNPSLMNLQQQILQKLCTETKMYNHRHYTICDLIKTPESLKIKHELKMTLHNDNENNFYTKIIINIKSKKPNKNTSIEISEKLHLELITVNSSIFIYGIYQKLSREMSQTPMTVNGKLKYERSVSDFTDSFKIHFGASSVKFAAAGREDADVRCFGRPFILEIINPTINLYNYNVRICLYSDVKIDNLLVVQEKAKNYILDGENKAKKIYRARLYVEKELDIELRTYDIVQRTPLRVLHRRSNLSRRRTITIVSYKQDGEYADIEFKADAGTYIKEFVSGDFGRTKPNLQIISGCYCELMYLDVLQIESKPLPESMILNNVTKIF